MDQFLLNVCCILFILAIPAIPLALMYLQRENKKAIALTNRDVQFISYSTPLQEIIQSVVNEISQVKDRPLARIEILSANEMGVVVQQSNPLVTMWQIRLDIVNHDPIHGRIYLDHAGIHESGTINGRPAAQKTFDAIIRGIRNADPQVTLNGAW